MKSLIVKLIMGLVMSSSLYGYSYAYESGLDRSASSLTITYNHLNKPGLPSFECFGHTNPNAPFSITLQALDFSDNWEKSVSDCFQQAGLYTVQVELVDRAGNFTSRVFTLNIKPDQIDFDNSPLTTLQDPPSADEPTANNNDYYQFRIFLKDKLDNPIDQIDGARVSLPMSFTDDANVGLSFRDGLRLNETISVPQTQPTEDNISDNDLTDGISFNLSSLVPSLAQMGPGVGYLADRSLDLRLAFAHIQPDGTPHSTDTQNINPTHVVRFHPLFTFIPTLPTYIFDEEPTIIDVEVNTHGLIDGVTPQRPDSALIYSPIQADFENQDLNEPGFELMDIVNSQNPTGPVGGLQLGITTHIYGRISRDVNVMTLLSYDYEGETISHPSYAAGALGEPQDPDCVEGDPTCDPCAILGLGPDCDPCLLEGVNCRPTPIGFIGASFETPVVIHQDRGLLDQNDTENITVFYNMAEQTNQVRDRMRNQVFELTSGLTTEVCPSSGFIEFETSGSDDLMEVFISNDVVLVEDCNVRIGSPTNGTVILPQGRKTLVIRNGNLRIENDLDYQTFSDSFGFILTNEATSDYPSTSNVFIKDSLHRISGSFFAEGSLFSFAGGPVPSDFGVIDDTSYITNGDNNDQQLVLMGTILSYNTIGGRLAKDDYDSHKLRFPDEDLPEKFYFTPWHFFDDSSVAADVGITNGEVPELVEKYDLHFLRRYRPTEAVNEDGDPWKCTLKPGSTTECEANPNAVIIRNDQRIVNNPPPGFSNLGSLDLGQ